MNDNSTAPSEKPKVSRWIMVATIALLIFLILFQLRQQTRLETSLAKQAQLEIKLEKCTNIISQQTSVINRALGKVIPIELPESLTAELAALEACIADQTAWPKSDKESETMLNKVRDLVHHIPPWAEDDLMPRLNAVRWAVQSLQMIQTSATAEGEALASAADILENQLSTQPEGGSKIIAAVLAKRQSEVAQRASTYRCHTAIKDAETQLASGAMTDGMAVLESLGEWKNSPTEKNKVLDLQKQLRSRLLGDEVARFAKTTETDLRRLSELTNTALRQAGHYKLIENITTQQLRLLEETDVPESTAKVLADLSALVEGEIKVESQEQRKKDDERVRGYQQWALENIAKFHKDFQKAQNQEGKWIMGKNTFISYPMIGDAIVNNLLPISPGCLDLAVGKIYSQAFEEGWNMLGGKDVKDEQTKVASKDALLPKKTPQNYKDEQL